MDDPAAARAKLARLEGEARKLAKGLLDARTAISEQRAKLDELIRSRLPPIRRLPTELLLSILSIEIHRYRGPRRKQELASVSCQWRDIILHTPSLWSTINVTWLNRSSIKIHLKRSREAPLTIVIDGGSPRWMPAPKLIALLDIVMSCAHRWYTLEAVGRGDASGYYPDGFMMFIFDKFKHLELPSLCRVRIGTDEDIYPLFSLAHTPALQHLDLGKFTPLSGLSAIPVLQTLRLAAHRGLGHPLFPNLIPTQKLTTLVLFGDVTQWLLQPNSIHFPVLRSLTVEVLGAEEFMKAIVSPNLEYLTYSSNSPSDAFGGVGSKFGKVRHISFSDVTPRCCSDYREYGGAMAFCEALPGIRHAELTGKDIPLFFQSAPGLSSTRRPADQWNHLESLVILNPSSNFPNSFTGLVDWLVDRRRLGFSQLRMKLVHTRHDPEAIPCNLYILQYYHDLKEYCSLEMEGFPLTQTMNIWLGENLPLMQSFPCFPRKFMRDIDTVFAEGDVCCGNDGASSEWNSRT